MAAIGTLLQNIIDLRVVTLAVSLALLALLGGFLVARFGKARRKKPGQYSVYRATGRTAAECKGILGANTPEDMFTYHIEATPKGGWYLNFKEYRPEQQIMDTVFLLQFENDNPAEFTLTFVSEAFGTREPIIPPALLASFFAQKLGAELVEKQAPGEG